MAHRATLLLLLGLALAGCSPKVLSPNLLAQALPVADEPEALWRQLGGWPGEQGIYRRACDVPSDAAVRRTGFRLAEHVLVSDSEGRLPDGVGMPARHAGSFPTAFRTIMGGYARWIEAAEQARQPRPRLLFYFNGGLNAQEDVEAQAARQIPCMLADGFYPIFFVWDTAYLRTYLEQVAAVTDGQIERSPRMKALAALRVPGDLISGLGDAPSDYVVHGRRFLQAVQREPHCYLELVPAADCPKAQRLAFVDHTLGTVDAERNVVINPEAVDRRQAEYGALAAYAATWPVRLISTPLAHGLGDSAWANMVRRTRTTVRQAIEFNLDRDVAAGGRSPPNQCPKDFAETVQAYPRGIGLFAGFLEQLLHYRFAGTPAQAPPSDQWRCAHDPATSRYHDLPAAPLTEQEQEQDQDRRIWCALRPPRQIDPAAWQAVGCTLPPPTPASAEPLRITLIGHSMGAIVINELLARFDDLPYENIVVMASAASLRETKRVLDRYFDRYFKEAKAGPACSEPGETYCSPDGRITRFFSLMLHPLNDARERQMLGSVPSGSLLLWVDEMYETPKTPEDKTFGFWPTAKSARKMFGAAAQNRMLYRVFNRRAAEPGEPGNPIKHADFNDDDMCFWRPSFWGVDGTELADRYRDLPEHARQPCLRQAR